jgi:hypothetical protein
MDDVSNLFQRFQLTIEDAASDAFPYLDQRTNIQWHAFPFIALQ